MGREKIQDNTFYTTDHIRHSTKSNFATTYQLN